MTRNSKISVPNSVILLLYQVVPGEGAVYAIPHGARFPVLLPEQQPLNNVKYKTDNEHDLDGPYDRVCSHKVSPQGKCLAAIIIEYQRIYSGINHTFIRISQTDGNGNSNG